MAYVYTTQSEVREAFWAMCAEFQPKFKRVSGRRQNAYHTDIRCRWVDFVDEECRNGNMSESLANRVTL